MAAQTNSGTNISVGDTYSILGGVAAISGTGPSATVTVTTRDGDTISVRADQCSGPQSEGPAQSRDGKHFSVGDAVSIPATCISVSGTGKTAQVTSQVISSTPGHPSTNSTVPVLKTNTVTHAVSTSASVPKKN